MSSQYREEVYQVYVVVSQVDGSDWVVARSYSRSEAESVARAYYAACGNRAEVREEAAA